MQIPRTHTCSLPYVKSVPFSSYSFLNFSFYPPVAFTSLSQTHHFKQSEIRPTKTGFPSQVSSSAVLLLLFLTLAIRKRYVLDFIGRREKWNIYLITALRRIVYGTSRQDHHHTIDIALLPVFCENPMADSRQV